jgi:hypothetical protein
MCLLFPSFTVIELAIIPARIPFARPEDNVSLFVTGYQRAAGGTITFSPTSRGEREMFDSSDLGGMSG